MYKSKDPKVQLYVVVVLSCSNKTSKYEETDFGILEFVSFKLLYLKLKHTTFSYFGMKSLKMNSSATVICTPNFKS